MKKAPIDILQAIALTPGTLDHIYICIIEKHSVSVLFRFEQGQKENDTCDQEDDASQKR
jgi:hypothetical protein